MAPLDNLIQANLADVVVIRHDLHQHPELGYEEFRTSSVVTQELAKLEIQHVGKLAGGTGVLAYLPSTAADPATAPTIALRADMDALPITEETGKPYASVNAGVMHACGHDGHTSIMIGVAKVLSKTERPNNVLLIFQPAEEGGAGAKRLCDEGVLDGRILGLPAERIFGLHGYPLREAGSLATRRGPLMASADGFTLRVIGKGGHAAMPHFGVDPIVVASHIIVALQTVASRNVSPLDSVVITIGEVKAGSAHNIIPNEAVLTGTLRALNETTRQLAIERTRQIASSVAEAFGGRTEIEWMHGYPVTWNDPVATDDFRRVMAEPFGAELVAEEIEPVMGAEDFSYYGAKTPACFYWLGLLPKGQLTYPNLHAPNFDFNDDAIPYGMRAMCSLATASYEHLGSRRELASSGPSA
jgi:amidohydrolase